MLKTITTILFLFSLLGLSACSDNKTAAGEPPIGSHNAACTEDGRCDDGLFCIKGTCASQGDLDIIFEALVKDPLKK